jgi:hypothetical protein
MSRKQVKKSLGVIALLLFLFTVWMVFLSRSSSVFFRMDLSALLIVAVVWIGLEVVDRKAR